MSSYLTLVQRQWPLLLFGFLCVFWGNFGQSFLLGWFSDAIKSSLAISAQQFGAIYSVATLASAACVLWLGGLIDRWSLPRFTLLVVGGLCCASLVLYYSHSLVMLAIGFFLIRLFGQGLLPHTGLTTMARYFHADRGKAISIAASGVSVGEIVLPGLVVALIGLSGWQGTWLWVALSTLVCLLPVLYWSLKRADVDSVHPAAEDAGSVPAPSGRKVLMSDYRYWLAAPTLLSLPFVLTAIFIHQDFILQQKSWTLAWMATCFVVYGVVHWLSSLLFGALVDRFSAMVLLRFYNLPLIIALLVVANFDGMWVAVAMMFLFGIAIGASGPVVGALWAEVYGTTIIGGIRSTASAIIVLSTAVSPVLFGWFIDHGFQLQFLLNSISVVLILGWFCLLGSYRTDRANS